MPPRLRPVPSSAPSSSFSLSSSLDGSNHHQASSSQGNNNSSSEEEEEEEVKQHEEQSFPVPPAQAPSSSSQVNATMVPTDVLVQLLSRLASPSSSSQSNYSPPVVHEEHRGTSVRPPDKFTGTDRSKLRTFLAQCRMAFLANPSKYPTERSKVMYSASYFDSVALSWFEPFLFMDNDDQNLPSFMNSFKNFESELTSLFGDPDAVATAEHKLHKLKMKEDHQVSRYITNFRRYQTVVHWDESALMYCFRKGLPSRILDELARRDEKPSSLSELEQVALRIDLRYWERQQERKESFEPSRSTSFSSKSNYQPIRQDKKLTQEEKERRIKNHLCMYCGEANHIAIQCPKRTTANITPASNKFNSSKLRSAHSSPSSSVEIPTNNSEPEITNDEQTSIRATLSLVNQSQGKF
jgi:Ty3 transposon capsid-like protein